MGTADVGHWTVRVGNCNLATRLFGKGTLEHGIPSHSLCVSGLVSESDECLPRFLCFGSPTMKSKALLHCNNNPPEASMIGKWLKWLDFSWLQWFCCMESMKRLGMIHNPLGAAWSRLRVVVASKTWKGSNRSVLESHAGQMGKLVMPRFTKRPSVGTWLCCAPEKKAVARENGHWSEVLSWVWQCPEGVLRSQGSSMFFQAYSIYSIYYSLQDL